MKRNVGVKLCVVVLIALIVYSMFASSAMALTREDVITKFLAQKDIKDLKESLSYEISAIPNEKSGIDVKVGMGTGNYENSFIFDGSTCKITLKSEEDELGKKLFKNMWITCAEIGSENGVKIEAITGEIGDNSTETFWTKFLEKVKKSEDTYVTYGVKLEKEKDGSYIGTINTKMYKVDFASKDDDTNNATNNVANNMVNNTANNTAKNVTNNNVKEFTTNVTRIPNAGNNQEIINVFRIIAFISVAAIIAFSIYNVKSKK